MAKRMTKRELAIIVLQSGDPNYARPVVDLMRLSITELRQAAWNAAAARVCRQQGFA